MAAKIISDIAKPVLVYGLTHALGAAFAPLVASLAKTAPNSGDQATEAALKSVMDRRTQILTDVIDQYAGGTAIKPTEFKRSPTAPDAKGKMLMGPWQAVWKELAGNDGFKAVAGPFQLFAMASIQRLAASGLPSRDAALLNNALVVLALGVFSYWLSAGSKSADPKVWASEAIDHSDIVDIVNSDIHVAIDRASLDRLAPHATTKAGAELTRRLLPLHNLFHVRRLFDAMKNGGDHAFGIQLH